MCEIASLSPKRLAATRAQRRITGNQAPEVLDAIVHLRVRDIAHTTVAFGHPVAAKPEPVE